jgi:hypothetical protein
MTLNNTITVNGRQYKAPEITFNAICDLEAMGVDLQGKGNLLNKLRGYLALALKDIDLAGNEIEEHLIAGGTLEEMTIAFTEAVENSRFFQALAIPAKENKQQKKSQKTSE